MGNGYEALRHGAAWLDLSARGRIIARGRDRARFLHNVTSNEVKKMAPGDSCYAFLLTPQGRIVADLYLICRADHFLIDTEPDLREKVRAQILKYKVADQVELEDVTETTVAVGVEGPGAEGIEAPVAARPECWQGLQMPRITETGQPGYRIFAAAEDKAEIIRAIEAAGAVAATAEEARTVRIENGRPRYGVDILETSLPQETEQMHAVSFTKGCYIGQEIVERIRARGHVNRHLVRMEIEAKQPPAAGRQTIDGREVDVTSAVYSPELAKVVALGYARG
jgi:tRNA-modifying protein YgfZ